MQAALLVLGALPPPAPGADVLARLDGARAGRAADRRIAAVMQRVVGHIVRTQVTPDLVVAPVSERIVLRQRVRLVVFLGGELRARDRLRPAEPGDPRALGHQRAGQRLGLAHAAARLAQLDAAIERVGAVIAHESLQEPGVRRVDVDGQPVAGADAIDQRVRLVGQPAGVEREDADRQRVPRDQVDDDHVFRAEARREDRRRVAGRDVAQQRDDVLDAPGCRIAIGRRRAAAEPGLRRARRRRVDAREVVKARERVRRRRGRRAARRRRSRTGTARTAGRAARRRRRGARPCSRNGRAGAARSNSLCRR